jgi:outer membrane cobalamin receptor
MTLEELMNIKVDGSTLEQKTLEETPAILTVVNSDQIRQSGARDLIDVLNLVPGITLGTDTNGAVSVLVRGLWAAEGKVLLLLDGEEMNEILYSSIQLGNHYPADMISRVEMIRGPGSAKYGGYAELAVINIVTQGADELNGFRAHAIYGRMNSIDGQRDIGMSFGKKLGDWKLSSYLFMGQGNRSDRNYTDSSGNTYNLAGNSALNPISLNLGASTDRLHLRFIYDNYNTTDQTDAGTNAPFAYNENFEVAIVSAKYNVPLSQTFTLVPELHLSQYRPWNTPDPQAVNITQAYYNVTAQELRGALTLKTTLRSNLEAYLGLESRIQHATNYSSGDPYPNGSNNISYYRKAVFTEVDWNPEFIQLTLGGRYEGQNAGGDAIVPRISAFKQIGDFGLKMNYSWGFREPGIENLHNNPNVGPETTHVLDGEIGYKISRTMHASVNLYDVTVLNPITYSSVGTGRYTNTGQLGSYGLEADYKIKDDWGQFDLNYSNVNTDANEPSAYQVPGHPEALLGAANHKVVANGNIKVLSEKLRLNLTEIYLSLRYGYDYDSTSATGLSIRQFQPAFLTNVFLERTDLLAKGFSLGIGVFNLLDQDFRFIQPYNGGHPPLPGPSRDWVVKAAYQVSL